MSDKTPNDLNPEHQSSPSEENTLEFTQSLSTNDHEPEISEGIAGIELDHEYLIQTFEEYMREKLTKGKWVAEDPKGTAKKEPKDDDNSTTLAERKHWRKIHQVMYETGKLLGEQEESSVAEFAEEALRWAEIQNFLQLDIQDLYASGESDFYSIYDDGAAVSEAQEVEHEIHIIKYFCLPECHSVRSDASESAAYWQLQAIKAGLSLKQEVERFVEDLADESRGVALERAKKCLISVEWLVEAAVMNSKRVYRKVEEAKAYFKGMLEELELEIEEEVHENID